MNQFVEQVMLFWSTLVGVIKTFTIFDFIDIVLVSYLVYKGIKLVRETRAEQLVKGIVILAVSYAIASFIHLEMLSFVLTNIFTFGLLAIIVVFQPELRRALEKVGRTKITEIGGFGNSESQLEKGQTWSRPIPQIVEACDRLSNTKTGALVVIERQTKLGDLLPAGTIIDARVSTQLLCNIFYPNSPMHDGAVILREGRVLAAGCFLPSTQKGEYMDKQLGSRHRAAVGMSENSDALILVVSEETGMISVAENGRLERGFNSYSLTQLLQDKLIPKVPEKEKKSRWFGRLKR
ncbi:MAG: TIGR00159 family protein [Clostridiales bacterium]|nr:MAG: TIGR00159 family protein [Clostridiales bacterium]